MWTRNRRRRWAKLVMSQDRRGLTGERFWAEEFSTGWGLWACSCLNTKYPRPLVVAELERKAVEELVRLAEEEE